MTIKQPEKVKRTFYLAISIALALCVLFAAVPLLSKGAAPQEYQVKAIYISNMAKFTQWPDGSLAGSGEQFNLYIIGEYRFGSAFGSLVGTLIHGRTLSVKQLKEWEDIPSDCRVLFIGIPDKGEMKRALENIEGRPILTISDETGFTTAGGIIELFTAGGKVRFRVNQAAAEMVGLNISSKLLKLAVPLEERAR
jgi:hypothetical protein